MFRVVSLLLVIALVVAGAGTILCEMNCGELAPSRSGNGLSVAAGNAMPMHCHDKARQRQRNCGGDSFPGNQNGRASHTHSAFVATAGSTTLRVGSHLYDAQQSIVTVKSLSSGSAGVGALTHTDSPPVITPTVFASAVLRV
jgi:hypothetical protein